MRPDLQMETNVSAATVDINDSVITCEKPTKIRWGILTLVYFSVFVAYMDRINLSVCAPLVMKDLGIDKVQLGMSMSAFFLAYWLLQIPGAMLSERFGIRKVGTIAILLWSLFTFLTPLALGFTSLLIIRFLFGIGEGPLLPNNGVAIAKWAGSKEKGIATGFMVGGAMLGPMVGPAVTVWIMTTWSWSMVFFSFGVLGIAMAAIWYGFVRDYPQKHPGVNQAELDYIGNGTTTSGAQAKDRFYEQAPWKKFLKSGQFWAAGIQFFCIDYCFFVFLVWLPLYLIEARGLSLKAMGLAASYPWIAITATVFASGHLSDTLLKGGASKFKARTIPALVGLLGCGIGFIMAGHSSSVNENLFWLSVCLGFAGFALNQGMAIGMDLGGRFGGSVVGWINMWGTAAGVVASTLTALLVKWVGWNNTLYVTAGILLLGAISWLFVKPDKPIEL